MNAAIQIDNVGKLYRITGTGPASGSLREDLAGWARKLVAPNKPVNQPRSTPDQGAPDSAPPGFFWALRDVQLTVAPGEVVGVVGRNGAGKSTLLKILARITPPTTGKIRYRGRVGSLLEIGTGFHRELTGRENIFLNGSILGMSRDQVVKKLDEIVAFAEVDRFLDMPVKFYSSGMYVRLAFAVAAHLDADILLIDEVLAVGDVRFQKKCLGKMENAAREQGRTVIFVSHNMNAVQRMCAHGVLLQEGRIACQGPVNDVIGAYLAAGGSAATEAGDWLDLGDAKRFGTGELRFSSVRYRSDLEAAGYQPYPDGALDFTLVITSDSSRAAGSVAVTFYTRDGTKLVNADTLRLGQLIEFDRGRNELHFRIKRLHLNSGTYVVGLYLADSPGLIFDHIESAFEITVVDLETNRLGGKPVYDGSVSCDFEVVKVDCHADRRADG
ncbi:MAG TPA: ABC transporter ATP-binding protein [Chthoniobacterales bacterium]|nr:ABC transporter ATP-binding protein [Chthoniobacterales bacterium]